MIHSDLATERDAREMFDDEDDGDDHESDHGDHGPFPFEDRPMSPQLTILSPAEQLISLARQASNLEAFSEYEARIIRSVAKHVVDVTADRDRLVGEVDRLGGVIRELHADLDAAQQENSRLESPDSDG